jgi:undecaprenyl-diphosphatase
MATTAERREQERGRLAVLWDVFYRVLRALFLHAHSFGSALGALIVLGTIAALAGTWGFAELAEHVRGGRTQAFDDAVLRWIGAHHTKFLDSFMLETTALGTWIVVLTIVGVAAMFLYLTRHHFSALLLLVATTGGIVLNNILKISYHRPRPDVFEWGTHAASWSFPSGHAMSATIVYGTVAYLAARLQKTKRARALTLLVALLFIVLICTSRLYLGVHYPSDVAAGIIIGFAWTGFCMATLEGLQRFAKRNAKQVLRHEAPAPTPK